MTPDAQMATLLEAVVLLLSNLLGGGLAALAWCVSDVDVRESRRWAAPDADPAEVLRRRYNRLIVTEDARFGEVGRLIAHALLAVVGIFWLLTPQPTNPDVIWWAIAVRVTVVGLSVDLIVKTLHHLIARWRFDKPWSSGASVRMLGPSLRLAWQDMQARNEVR
jgi:hypothetical protein